MSYQLLHSSLLHQEGPSPGKAGGQGGQDAQYIFLKL